MITTHRARLSAIEAAVAEIEGMAQVTSAVQRIRIEREI